MFYFYSSSKERRSSAAVPEERIYVYNSGKIYTEIKFLAEYEDFKMVVFKIGKSQGTYIITAGKVEPFDSGPHLIEANISQKLGLPLTLLFIVLKDTIFQFVYEMFK